MLERILILFFSFAVIIILLTYVAEGLNLKIFDTLEPLRYLFFAPSILLLSIIGKNFIFGLILNLIVYGAIFSIPVMAYHKDKKKKLIPHLLVFIVILLQLFISLIIVYKVFLAALSV